MHALTIWQPWASLVMIGAKPFEFRRWDYRTRAPSLEGQRIVIHAGARPIKPDEIRDLIERLTANYGAGVPGTGLRPHKALPLLHRIAAAYKCQDVVELAAGLGTAILGKPRRCTDLFKGKVADSDRIDQHMWAWPMLDIQPWPAPAPMKGAQGFWRWPLNAEAA